MILSDDDADRARGRHAANRRPWAPDALRRSNGPRLRLHPCRCALPSGQFEQQTSQPVGQRRLGSRTRRVAGSPPQVLVGPDGVSGGAVAVTVVHGYSLASAAVPFTGRSIRRAVSMRPVHTRVANLGRLLPPRPRRS
jgi:hypothetical protein